MRMFMEDEHIRKLSFKALSAIKQKRRGGEHQKYGRWLEVIHGCSCWISTGLVGQAKGKKKEKNPQTKPNMKQRPGGGNKQPRRAGGELPRWTSGCDSQWWCWEILSAVGSAEFWVESHYWGITAGTAQSKDTNALRIYTDFGGCKQIPAKASMELFSLPFESCWM